MQKALPAGLRQIQARAEEVFGQLPAEFIQVVMRAPGGTFGADTVIYTHDPEALAESKGWKQVHWDNEFQNLGPSRKINP